MSDLSPGEREMQRVRGYRMLHRKSTTDPEGTAEAELMAFMAIFHPDHPMTPTCRAEARKLMKD